MTTQAPTPPLLPKRPRDLRIDFFRGVALLAIFTNHLSIMCDVPYLRFLTWRTYGFSDAAELFFFLSGFVCGRSYLRAAVERGFAACQVKALRRAGVLLAANSIVMGLVLAMCWAAAQWDAGAWDRCGINEFARRPLKSLVQFIGFQRYDYGFNILPMYMLFLAFLPAMLFLGRRHWAIPVACSLLLYAGAHGIRFLKSFPLVGLNFNPLAWQFIFFLGMALSMRPASEPGTVRRFNWPVGIAIAVFLILCVLKWVQVRVLASDQADLEGLKHWFVSWANRKRMSPLRLIHFLALAYLVKTFVPAGGWLARWAWARALMRVGQRSLFIFCLGLVLNYAMLLCVRPFEVGPAGVVAFNFIGWAALLVAAQWAPRLAGARASLAGAIPVAGLDNREPG